MYKKYMVAGTKNIMQPKTELVAKMYEADPDKYIPIDEKQAEGGQGGAGEKALSQMTKAELAAKAKSLGIEVASNATNDQIRDLIKQAEGGQ